MQCLRERPGSEQLTKTERGGRCIGPLNVNGIGFYDWRLKEGKVNFQKGILSIIKLDHVGSLSFVSFLDQKLFGSIGWAAFFFLSGPCVMASWLDAGTRDEQTKWDFLFILFESQQTLLESNAHRYWRDASLWGGKPLGWPCTERLPRVPAESPWGPPGCPSAATCLCRRWRTFPVNTTKADARLIHPSSVTAAGGCSQHKKREEEEEEENEGGKKKGTWWPRGNSSSCRCFWLLLLTTTTLRVHIQSLARTRIESP